MAEIIEYQLQRELTLSGVEQKLSFPPHLRAGFQNRLLGASLIYSALQTRALRKFTLPGAIHKAFAFLLQLADTIKTPLFSSLALQCTKRGSR